MRGWVRMSKKMNHENHENHEIKRKGLVPKLRFPEFRDSGEWESFKLGDKEISFFVKERIAIEQVTLVNYVSTENILPNYNGVTVASKLPPTGSCTRFNTGDILISNIRPYLKKVWAANRSGGSSNDVIVVRSKSKIEKIFLALLLCNDDFINYVMKGAKGVKMPRGDVSLMKEYPIAIPKPPEQQKIADCLTSLDELITAEVGKLEAYKAHKKGLMQKLFPAEGETVPEWRFPEFRGKGEWETNEFSKYIVLYRGSSPRPIQEYLTKNDNGVNWIKIGDTKAADNYVIYQVEEKITPKGAEKSRKVSKGELILANSMSFGKTYQLAIDGYIYDGWFVLREYEKYFHKQFLLQLLNSEYMQNQYIRLSAGGIVQNISSDIVYNTILPHTSFLEQQKIADCLSSLDELITAQAQKINTLKTHKKGLMQRLFPSAEEVGV